MADRNRELVPDNCSLVRERAFYHRIIALTDFEKSIAQLCSWLS